ncbi:chorismate mutase [Candidatus Ozemobacteraceae bacterium]|nr:chorismate mutase [Candidatus Ozemobacteraceae bacterium]
MNPTTPPEYIGELRREIDLIDAQIVALLDRRAETALRIGACKKEAGLPSPLDAAREADVLERVGRTRRGPFPENTLFAIYREIVTACRNLQGS